MPVADNNSLNIINDGHHLCWSCKEEVGAGPFCGNCVKIQPLNEHSDYFAMFGLESAYELDPANLRKPFYELSKKFHPDFYSQMTNSEQIIARDNTAYLNTALKVLSDPIKRADYLLSILSGSTKSNPTPPQDLFDEILEVGEYLINDDITPDQRNHLSSVQDKFTVIQTNLLDTLHDWFEKLKNDDTEATSKIESRLNNIKYLRTIITRIDQRLKATELK